MTVNLFSYTRSPGKREAGFTLVELMVVVAIIALVGAIAIPNLSPANARLKQAARELYGNLQKARMEAVKTNQSVGIVFDTANNQYFLCQNVKDNTNSNCTDAGEQIVDTTCGDPANSISCAVDNTKLCCDLNSYGSSVQYGYGPATINATTAAGACPANCPASGVTYTSSIVIFTPRGTLFGATGGYTYLQDNRNHAYVVATPTIAGAVVMRKWTNNSWQ